MTTKELLEDISNKFETLSGIIAYENKSKLDKRYYEDLCFEVDEFVKELRNGKIQEELEASIRKELLDEYAQMSRDDEDYYPDTERMQEIIKELEASITKRMQEIIKELEASIRKEVEDKLMRAWDDMEHRGIKFCENDDWRNYKFVRNSIRDIIQGIDIK